MTTIVQISDIHMVADGKSLYDGIDPARRLSQALARVAGLPFHIDALVVTGDLTANGTETEARRLSRLLEGAPAPVFVLPGNHDARDNIRDVLGRDYMPASGPANYVVNIKGLRLIALDTTVAGEEYGYLDEDTMLWLEATLLACDTPSIIAMHHPPLDSHNRAMDLVGLRNADDFLRSIPLQSPIERIICGHLHRSVFGSWGGWSVSVAPSPSFALPLGGEAELTSFYDEPCGFHLHLYADPIGLVTHIVYTEDWGSPIYF